MAVHQHRIRPIHLKVRSHVTHLIYADDLLVFMNPSFAGLHALEEVLHTFASNTGLHLNRDKSTVYFNLHCPDKEERANVLKMAMGELPEKYLGPPIDQLC